jgi:mRNA-degrading endonuclease YafQ of YafQ-DinJ toxin-antitoxin module
MWKIYEHKWIEKQLKSCSIEVLKKHEKWKDIVAISGPQGLLLIKGFSDEVLKGEWNGYRSSRLNQQYRVIYKIMVDGFMCKLNRCRRMIIGGKNE